MKLFEEIVAGNTKAAAKAAGAGSRDLYMVPRGSLNIIPNFNIRTKGPELTAHVRAIADSMKVNGFHTYQPVAAFVSVENGVDVINVFNGHCRLAAYDLAVSEGADLGPIPTVVSPRGTTMEDITAAMWTTATGLNLTPYQQSILVKRLIGFGMEPAAVAEKVAISQTYVMDLLTLAEAPAPIRKLVESGKVSATLAVAELKKNPEKAGSRLADAVERAEAKGKKKATKKDVEPKQKLLIEEITEEECVALWGEHAVTYLTPQLQEDVVKVIRAVAGRGK